MKFHISIYNSAINSGAKMFLSTFYFETYIIQKPNNIGEQNLYNCVSDPLLERISNMLLCICRIEICQLPEFPEQIFVSS